MSSMKVISLSDVDEALFDNSLYPYIYGLVIVLISDEKYTHAVLESNFLINKVDYIFL